MLGRGCPTCSFSNAAARASRRVARRSTEDLLLLGGGVFCSVASGATASWNTADVNMTDIWLKHFWHCRTEVFPGCKHKHNCRRRITRSHQVMIVLTVHVHMQKQTTAVLTWTLTNPESIMQQRNIASSTHRMPKHDAAPHGPRHSSVRPHMHPHISYTFDI